MALIFPFIKSFSPHSHCLLKNRFPAELVQHLANNSSFWWFFEISSPFAKTLKLRFFFTSAHCFPSQPLTNNFSWQKNSAPFIFSPLMDFRFIPPCLSPIKSRIVHLLDSVNELYFRDPIYFAFYRASSEIVRSIILYIPITVMGILIIWNPISRLDAGEHVAFPILDFMMHRRQKRCSG